MTRDIEWLPRAERDARFEFRFLPKLKALPPFLVGHWTGGSGDVAGVFATLVARRLSVHFHINRAGRLVQLAPMNRRCAHAGSRGNVGLGVEVTSKGTDGFTLEQLATFVALSNDLAALFGWPMVVPASDTRVDDLLGFGVVEHRNLTTRKVDAGGLLRDELLRRGWESR